MKSVIIFCFFYSLFFRALSQIEQVDTAVINKIKKEGLENSKVMETVWWLTDVYGPRMTGSPGFKGACDWSVKSLHEYKLENVRKEQLQWGRSWYCKKFSVRMLEPQYSSLIAVPMPWSPGTKGKVSGEVIKINFNPFRVNITKEEIDSFYKSNKGILKNKIILLFPLRNLRLQENALSKRFIEKELDELKMPIPQDTTSQAGLSRERVKELQQYIVDFFQYLRREGVLALLSPAGNGGTIGSTIITTAYRDSSTLLPPAILYLTSEHYNRIWRLVDKKIPVKLEVELQTTIVENTPDAYNVIAEIPGGKKISEIIMAGAHLDSWAAGTGATDDAAGCAVIMEAMRILKALNLKMDRTVRMALWGGHEGAGLGAWTYIKNHFADWDKERNVWITDSFKNDHTKLSCYFNLDHGAGKIRGIYLEENGKAKPIFEKWFEPFKDIGATAVSIRKEPYGTDVASFDQAGLPAFQFIQDPLEYDTRTHHTNMDVYDRLQPDDLKQATVIMASFIYLAAMRDEMFPRKDLSVGQKPN